MKTDRRWDSLISALAVLFTALAVACGPEDEFLARVKPFDKTEEHEGEDDAKSDLHKYLHPLDAPDWVRGAAAPHMLADDAVVGYVAGDHAWAIPWWVLKNHHVANLTLDGTAVCIILCERCSSASGWDPVVDGTRLHLRVNGLYNGTIACIDDETRSWWTPFLGEGMSGPLKGRKLARRRVDQATWADWLELHPETLVANDSPEARKGHSEKESPGQAFLGPTMKRSILHKDARIPMHDLVLGVDVNGEARAYPMKQLDEAGAFLEDTVGGVAIVILHKPGTWLAAAFRRELDGEPLHFVKGDDGAPRDERTKSRWNTAGIAREGSLAGKQLTPVAYLMEEFYIWATQHPGASVHGVQ